MGGHGPNVRVTILKEQVLCGFALHCQVPQRNILTIIMITYLETRCIPDSCHLARSKIKTRNVIQKIEKMVRIFLFLL